ncbi:MAG: GEVED domain-containing protein [Fluviicola sp.]
MKKIKLLVLFSFLCSIVFAQESIGGRPFSFAQSMNGNSILPEAAIVTVTKPNLTSIHAEDAINDSKMAYRVGLNLPVSITASNSGTWTTLLDGTRIWRLKIASKDAKALGLYFNSTVEIPVGAKLFAYNKNQKQILGAYTANSEKFEAMEMVQGDELTLEYIASPGTVGTPLISIKEVVYFYRGVEDHTSQFESVSTEKAESCEVDVACSEGASWQNQIKSVVHYTFTQSGNTYVCSAALINNTAQDCKPYILTAWHCGEPAAGTTLSGWVWYWKYQKSTCQPGNANGTDPSPGSFTKTGGTVRASSENGTLNNPPGTNEVAGSDFYLVELSSSISSTYDPYYAGWNRTNTAATSGVGVHHPAGSAKKISTYTSALVSSTYNGGATNAHWRVVWAATANGHGVTEGGSSGSPIFNQSGLIVGQLSGGSSFCTNTSAPDLYGKLFTDWDLNGTTSNAQLKPWLDPSNTGVTTLAGSASPCTASGTAPVANFTASATNISVNTTVTFTDISTNSPTSWSWSVSPATGWSYTGGTSATSQNPQIIFTATGSYTITLTATNSFGSDQEVKTNHIVVTAATSPCTGTSTGNCTTDNEFVQNFTFDNINNTTSCSNYTSYTLTANVVKGETINFSVTPQIVGQAAGTMYNGDEIAVYIDYNNDLDFSDAGERVAYVIAVTGVPTVTSFSTVIPLTAVTGTVNMRVRINYNDAGTTPINPCGTSAYGEVEDYKVAITTSSAFLNESQLAEVGVYPNPFKNEISVDASSIEGTLNVELVDFSGKVLSVQQVTNELKVISTTELAAGVYTLRLSNGTTTSVRRIIKL